jgi:EmrB/QacA subfamily drug resistance transporter
MGLTGDFSMKIKSMSSIQYVICLGAFLSNLSAGMFNIALVDIAGEFHQSLPSAQWVIMIYLLTISVCLPIMGCLGDMKGKRMIHNLGYFTFMIGSLCCALSPNLTALIGFRILQGVGASMYQANNMALVVSLFPPEKRGRALGTVSTFVAAGALIGPSLGGIIVQWFSWRFNFWLLAAVTMGAWLLAQRLIPQDVSAKKATKLDIPGSVFFALALSGLVIGLTMGPVWGWGSLAVWLFFLAAIVFSVVFVLWSLSPKWELPGRGEPFIVIGVFSHPYILFGVLIAIVTYLAAFTTQIVLPVYLRNVMHIEPALAGLIVMGYPASLIFSAPLSGRISDKFGSIPIISCGLTLMTASLATLSLLSANTAVIYILLFVVIFGCSMGMITSPNNSIVMSKASPKNLGLISSMLALNRNLGMMLGAVVGGIVMSAAPNGNQAQNVSIPVFLESFKLLFSCLAVLILATLLLFLLTLWWNEKKRSVTPRARRQRESVV